MNNPKQALLAQCNGPSMMQVQAPAGPEPCEPSHWSGLRFRPSLNLVEIKSDFVRSLLKFIATKDGLRVAYSLPTGPPLRHVHGTQKPMRPMLLSLQVYR